MNWENCIESAKRDLEISGYTNRWTEVVDLAKKKYWEGKAFKELKNDTIQAGNGICLICENDQSLTAHHVNYGNNEETICVCNKCHKIIHELQNTYGFIMQLVLLYYKTPNIIFSEFPNLTNMSCVCFKKLEEECNPIKIDKIKKGNPEVPVLELLSYIKSFKYEGVAYDEIVNYFGNKEKVDDRMSHLIYNTDDLVEVRKNVWRCLDI